MAILVKNMKMPSSCCDPNDVCDLSWCGVLCKAHNLDDISDYDKERAPFCPLVEVPTPHGRWLNGKCSECGCAPLRRVYQGGEVLYEEGFAYHFCPNCGAKMDLTE